MPWIRIIDENEAAEDLKKSYQKVMESRGKISNIMKIHSLNPRAMEAHMELYLALMFGPSGLEREERELIGVVVSSANSCQYCVKHHAEALNHYWKDNKKIQEVIQNFKSPELQERLRHMLEYVVKLTKTPHAINQTDISALHKSGFSDENILNINLITSYFCFVNRIVLGLGVEFTPDDVKGYKY